MTIAAVLRGKGSSVETIGADTPLFDAVGRLGEKRIGALPVVDEDGSKPHEATVVGEEQLGDGRGPAGLRPYAGLGHGAHLFPPDDAQAASNVHTG